MIKVSVLERETSPVSSIFQPADALVDLVSRLSGGTGISSIGPTSLTLDCPTAGKRVKYEGEEDDMDLLVHVSYLYYRVYPWLSKSVQDSVEG